MKVAATALVILGVILIAFGIRLMHNRNRTGPRIAGTGSWDDAGLKSLGFYVPPTGGAQLTTGVILLLVGALMALMVW